MMRDVVLLACEPLEELSTPLSYLPAHAWTPTARWEQAQCCAALKGHQ